MEILKIGFSAGGLGKTKGCEEAPDKIIEVLDNMSICSEDGKGISFRVSSVSINQSNIEETNENIFNVVLKVNKCIILGGDHSITYAAFKSFVKNNPNSGLIVFDAHPDCEHNFSPPTHEDYLRVLIEEGYLDPSKVILVGLRAIHGEEMQYLKNKRILYFDMKKIMEFGVREVCDLIMERALQWSGFYLSIDIDAVDPAFAPGTGYPESGGLSAREMIYFVQRLKKMRNHKITDIVEVNPLKDINNITVKLAAKLVVELG